jgi:hypothetical protein
MYLDSEGRRLFQDYFHDHVKKRSNAEEAILIEQKLYVGLKTVEYATASKYGQWKIISREQTIQESLMVLKFLKEKRNEKRLHSDDKLN